MVFVVVRNDIRDDNAGNNVFYFHERVYQWISWVCHSILAMMACFFTFSCINASVTAEKINYESSFSLSSNIHGLWANWFINKIISVMLFSSSQNLLCIYTLVRSKWRDELITFKMVLPVVILQVMALILWLNSKIIVLTHIDK